MYNKYNIFENEKKLRGGNPMNDEEIKENIKKYRVFEVFNICCFGVSVMLLVFGFIMKDSLGVQAMNLLPTNTEMNTGIWKPGAGFFAYIGIISISIIGFFSDVIIDLIVLILTVVLCGVAITAICMKISGICKKFEDVMLNCTSIKIQNTADVFMIIILLMNSILMFFL